MHPLSRLIGAADVPRLARPSYVAEMRHMSLWGMFASLVDGSFSSIIVAKTFGAPELVPVVWATPMLAHLLSFLWSAVIRGRPRIRTFLLLACGAILASGSIALTPSDAGLLGGLLFTLQIGVARIFLSGLVNLRTSIWKANYPHSHRARIASRIQALNALLMLAVGALASTIFDRHAEYYQVVYPTLAALGLLALLPLRQLRIRGEQAELRSYRRSVTAVGGWRQLARNFSDAVRILRTDRDFSRYCGAQYLLGSSNFMVDPVLSLFLTQTLQLRYFGSYLILEQIPTIVALATMPLWARYFDRVGVLRFRVVNTAFWLVAITLAAAALGLHSLAIPYATPLAVGLLVAARLVNGIGRGGGAIGWNLGHLHFAGRLDADLYMGIHVALTGLRGIIMPFVGTFVYSLVGPPAMLLSIALCIAAWLAFRRLAGEEAR
ncbi:MAG: hypothetical protein IPM13_04075 [Phycisphaerales bacterium]|nr:hypothetical protein [Phycisphaerales bacterium]